MRKKFAAVVVTALMLLAMTGSAKALTVAYDAGPDGFAFSYTSFPLLGSGKLELADPGDLPQYLIFRILGLPIATLRLEIASMAPDSLSPKLTVHCEFSSWLAPQAEFAVDVNLPFGHGGVSNKTTYIGLHPSYELEGVLKVGRQTSSYVMNFGLWNLHNTWKAEANEFTPTIQQVITRSNGDKFASISMEFDQQLLTCQIGFIVTITPHQPATQDDTFVLAGSLPVPYGSYHFWFYRDPKN